MARTAAQYQVLLDKVDTAIEALLDDQCQSTTVDGRTFTRVNLDDLFKLQTFYQRQINRLEASSTRRVAEF